MRETTKIKSNIKGKEKADQHSLNVQPRFLNWHENLDVLEMEGEPGGSSSGNRSRFGYDQTIKSA